MSFIQTLLSKRSSLVLALLALTAIGSAAAVACGGGSGNGYAAPPPATMDPYTSSAPQPTQASQPSPTMGAASIKVASGALGDFLTGPNGKTLYVFLRDIPDTSNCTGGCLDVWTPLIVTDRAAIDTGAGASGQFGLINTPSGKQVTYNRAPLYYYAGDAKPGDTNGHLVQGIWFVARPDTASTAVVGVRGSGAGAQVVGPNGMTLYVFAKDMAGVSNCNGQCLQTWPALTLPMGIGPTAVDAAHGSLALISRAGDGARQVTYNGMPLYFFAGDKLLGDTKGDGVGGVWSIARP